MPRPTLVQVPLSLYKGRASFLVHKIRRDDFLDKLALRYPIYSRLPESWRKSYETRPPLINQELSEATKRPHHEGLWVMKDGAPKLFEKIPINVQYTNEVREGLWGGEGIIKGWKHARGLKKKPTNEREWRPPVKKNKILYSEVLEREITTTVTPRTLMLIDEAYGFDHYILKTPVHELCSDLGSRLKREMLLRLINKDTEMYTLDPEKREKIYNRYKKYIIPKEQAEWVGLTLFEAMQKQWDMEEAQGLRDSVPLLKIYTEELKEKLKLKADQESQEVETVEQMDTDGAVFRPKEKIS